MLVQLLRLAVAMLELGQGSRDIGYEDQNTAGDGLIPLSAESSISSGDTANSGCVVKRSIVGVSQGPTSW